MAKDYVYDGDKKVLASRANSFSSAPHNERKVSGLPNNYGEKKNFNVGSFFTVIVSILLVFAVFRVLMSQEPLSFAGLLNALQNAPSIDLTFLTDFAEVSLNFPTWLSFLEPIITFILDLVSVLGFVFGGLIQALFFIVYLLKWLLVG